MNIKKLLNLALMVVTALFIFFSLNIDVYADELSFAVAPSKVVDLVIEPGHSENLTFKVGNRSVFPSHQVEKNELYNFNINVEGILYDSENTEIDSKDIIKFDKTTLRCKPNEAVTVDVNINIPEDFEKNSYQIAIIFTRMPIPGVEDTTNTSAITSIKVPIYLGVGNPDEYSKLKTNFDIEKFEIDLGENKSVFKYALGYLKELITLNPLKVINVFSSISQKDMYVVNSGKNMKIDIISDFFTGLDSVTTKDERKLNSSKYVLISDDDLKKAVKNIYFEEKLVRIQLEGGSTVKIPCENRVRDHIRSQINTLMREYELKSPELQFFIDNLKVPKNNTYNIPQYNVCMRLKNTGEKETFITSDIVLKKDSTHEIGRAKLELITLQKDNVADVKIPLELTGEFSNGTYYLNGNFIDIKKVSKTANFKFDVNLNLDKQIFLITLIMYISIIVLLVVLVLLILKRFRNKNGIYGYITKSSLEYTDIIQNEDNFNTYKDLLNIENIEELSKYKLVLSLDVIVRNKPDCKNSKIINTLHQGSIIELIDENMEIDSILWVKVKFNNKMINR